MQEVASPAGEASRGFEGEVSREVAAAAESLVEALREVEAQLGGRGEEEAV